MFSTAPGVGVIAHVVSSALPFLSSDCSDGVGGGAARSPVKTIGFVCRLETAIAIESSMLTLIELGAGGGLLLFHRT